MSMDAGTLWPPLLAKLMRGEELTAGDRVTAYLGKSLTPTGTPPPALDFDAGTAGVFVG